MASFLVVTRPKVSCSADSLSVGFLCGGLLFSKFPEYPQEGVIHAYLCISILVPASFLFLLDIGDFLIVLSLL